MVGLWAGLIGFSYLLGSIPTAYLAGRWLKGIDIRDYGSGTVSGSMIWEHVSRWAILPVGIFDLFKVWLSAWFAQVVGLGPWGVAICGLAAVVGHNWPLFLGFSGGRGIGGFLSIWLLVFPWGSLWMFVFLVVGWLLGDSAPAAIASLVLLPGFSKVIGGPAIVLPLSAAMLGLALAKRLEANRRPLPPAGRERRRVILRRLFFDRDIASHKDWLRRVPEGRSNARSD